MALCFKTTDCHPVRAVVRAGRQSILWTLPCARARSAARRSTIWSCAEMRRKNTGMLTHEEALKLICLLEEYAGRPGAQAVHLLPAGAGKSEILHARRQEVHLRRAVPAARTVHAGRNGFIPLSQEAAGVVRRLPRRKDAPRLLPRRRESSHVCFLCLESPAPMPEENGISPS